MNNPFNPILINARPTGGFPATPSGEGSLQHFVNRQIAGFQDLVVNNKTVVINEVSGDIRLTAPENKIASVIRELLTTVVANSRDSHIHVSADRFRDIILFNIQDRNNNNGYALEFSIMALEARVAEAGGSLSIYGKQQKVATISFSFPHATDNTKYYC